MGAAPGEPVFAEEWTGGLDDELHGGQLRFAERFIRAYGTQYLHVHGLGWHEYDGARWAECLDGSEHRAALAVVKEARLELGRLSSDAAKELLRDITKVESAAGLDGMLSMAENMHPCALAAVNLDASPFLLNTRNGTVNLETGEVRHPNPGDHLSKVTAVAFDPAARSEVFEKFLERVQPDPEMRSFLARSLGSSLLGLVRDHKLHIWNGTGANGKGTLRDAVRYALGDYAVEVPPSILLLSKYASSGEQQRMRLKGARAVFCSEIQAGAAMDEATMKRLTGGDPVDAKQVYQKPITFDPSHTLFMLTNHLPMVHGDDPAVWRRILTVPFGEEITAAEMDGELPERLKAGANGVLAWLWHGWLDYQANGLNPPKAVLTATEQYRLDSDPLARFLADEDAVLIGHGTVGSAKFYQGFKDWANGQGEKVEMTNKAFSAAMEVRGHRKKQTSHGAEWQNLSLVVPDPSDYA